MVTNITVTNIQVTTFTSQKMKFSIKHFFRNVKLHFFVQCLLQECSLRTSSINVTKSAGNCGFGHIYRRNPNLITLFLCGKSKEFQLISCCANCAFPENFHTRKLSEFTVFYAMSVTHLCLSCEKIQNQNQFERH